MRNPSTKPPRPEYLVIDSDSQFTYQAMKAAPTRRPHDVPPDRVLLAGRRVRFQHGVFGEHHDVFPVSIRELNEPQLEALAKDFLPKAREAFKGDPKVHLVIYPGEATIDRLVDRILQLPIAAKAVRSSLNPAFRRFGDAQLRCEVRLNRLKADGASFNILYLDDCYGTGRAEARVMAAVRAQLGSDIPPIKWLTYVVIARDAASLEPELPGTPLLRRGNRFGIKRYAFHYFSAIGPHSLTSSDCPLCAAHHKARRAREWAQAARPQISQRLVRLEERLRPVGLADMIRDIDLLPPELEVELVSLHTRPFPLACLSLLSEGPRTIERIQAELVFICLNYRDALAYVPPEHLVQLFRQTAETVNDDEKFDLKQTKQILCCDIWLLCAVLLPVSVLLEIHCAVLPSLVRAGRSELIGAVHAVIMAFNQAVIEMLEAERDAGPAILRDIARKAYTRLDRALGAQTGVVAEADVVLSLQNDLLLMAEKPRPENELWLARTLIMTLAGGKHSTFYKHMLKNPESDFQMVRFAMRQCLDLLQRLMHTAALGNADAVDSVLAEVDTATSLDALRPICLTAIDHFWKDTYAAQLVYTDEKLGSVLSEALNSAATENARNGIFVQRYQIVKFATYSGDWHFLGPLRHILFSHFENLWKNTIRHYYQDQTISGDDYTRHLKDADLQMGPVIAYAGLCIHETEGEEYFSVVVSDRGQLAPRDSLSRPGGLSSATIHLRAKGGGTSYHSSSDLPPWLKRQLELWNVDPCVYRNHYVTDFPVLLKSRTAQATKTYT